MANKLLPRVFILGIFRGKSFVVWCLIVTFDFVRFAFDSCSRYCLSLYCYISNGLWLSSTFKLLSESRFEWIFCEYICEEIFTKFTSIQSTLSACQRFCLAQCSLIWIMARASHVYFHLDYLCLLRVERRVPKVTQEVFHVRTYDIANIYTIYWVCGSITKPNARN